LNIISGGYKKQKRKKKNQGVPRKKILVHTICRWSRWFTSFLRLVGPLPFPFNDLAECLQVCEGKNMSGQM
jgi:hypothetical protein